MKKFSLLFPYLFIYNVKKKKIGKFIQSYAKKKKTQKQTKQTNKKAKKPKTTHSVYHWRLLLYNRFSLFIYLVSLAFIHIFGLWIPKIVKCKSPEGKRETFTFTLLLQERLSFPHIFEMFPHQTWDPRTWTRSLNTMEGSQGLKIQKSRRV